MKPKSELLNPILLASFLIAGAVVFASVAVTGVDWFGPTMVFLTILLVAIPAIALQYSQQHYLELEKQQSTGSLPVGWIGDNTTVMTEGDAVVLQQLKNTASPHIEGTGEMVGMPYFGGISVPSKSEFVSTSIEIDSYDFEKQAKLLHELAESLRQAQNKSSLLDEFLKKSSDANANQSNLPKIDP